MNVRIKVFGLVFLLLILVGIYLNMNMNKLIHQRVLNAYIPTLLNHPLGQAYKESMLSDNENKLLGFERISPFIKSNNLKYDVSEIKTEINRIMYEEPHQRLGQSLTVAGGKRSYQLRLFGTETKYTQFASKCLELVDKIASDLNAQALSVSLAVMYPNTWLKYHEGFWGYSEFVTRAMLGINVPENSCAVHVEKEQPQILEEGKVITFDDCKKHEAWNTSKDQTRVVLIFDLCNHGVRYGLDGIKDIENTINERKITNEKNYDRKKLSLDTIETIKNQLLLNTVY